MQTLGDSRTPLCFLIIAALTNTVLDYVFIVNVGMGVAGADLATVLSQKYRLSSASGLFIAVGHYCKFLGKRLLCEEIRYHLNMGFR